jgi:hypothetical protein
MHATPTPKMVAERLFQWLHREIGYEPALDFPFSSSSSSSLAAVEQWNAPILEESVFSISILFQVL